MEHALGENITIHAEDYSVVHGNRRIGSDNTHASASDNARRDFYICTSAESGTSATLEDLLEGKECSMCGDVGISGDLFQCRRCNERYQHLYCSRSYPNLGSEKWMCNWCLHADSNTLSPNQQKGKLKREPVWTENNASESLLQIAESLPGAGIQQDNEVDRCIRSSQEINPVKGYMNEPKRQRCIPVKNKNKVTWKTTSLLTSSKGNVRRYKLLTDVLR